MKDDTEGIFTVDKVAAYLQTHDLSLGGGEEDSRLQGRKGMALFASGNRPVNQATDERQIQR